MEALDLPGPAFLGLYAVLLTVAITVALWMRWALRAPGGELPPAALQDLDPYEVACLAGRDDLAVNAALAALCRRGALGADPAAYGRMTVKEPPPPGAADLHPVEQAVYAAVLHDPSRTCAQLRAAGLPEVRRLRHRLQTLGLALSPDESARARMRPVYVMLAVLAFGAAKIAVGLVRERPIVFLMMMVFVALFATIGFLAASEPWRTRRGERVLELLRLRNSALRMSAKSGATLLAPRDFALAVSLFGLGLLFAGPLAAEARAIVPPGSGSSGGGGSCGGGDGGGGGGGGCGGCGGGG
jgi:uncharacterized protein (TIGR04222 family)